ncbi:MAG TPA: SRPBCC family protein [Ktedonobacteraceae bacterium]|nr:SRPBCC family protein [Ktedonobacteraceae bacterium]
MPRIQHSILISEEPRKVFEIINDIEQWPVLFKEYHAARILKREDDGRYTKLIFQLTNAEESSWRSSRLLDHQELVATAEREEPLYPFVYMHLKWVCEKVAEGTKMTWTQDFELDASVELPLPTVLERMRLHTQENQQCIKEKIESRVAAR